MSVIASLPLYQPPTSRQDLKSDGRSPTCTKADPSNTTLDSNTVLPSHPKRKRTSVAIPQGQKDDDQLSTSNGTKSSALEERVLSLPGHGRGKPSATNLQSEEDDGAAVAPSQTTQLEETPKSPLTRPERRESEGASSPARPLDDHTSASPGIQHRSARSDRQLDVALLSMSSANLHRLAQRVQVEVGRRLGLENRD